MTMHYLIEEKINSFSSYDRFSQHYQDKNDIPFKNIHIITAWTMQNKGGGVSLSVKNTVEALKKNGMTVNIPLKNMIDSWDALDLRVNANINLNLLDSYPCLCIDIDGFSIKGIRWRGRNFKLTHVRTNFMDIANYEKGHIKDVCQHLTKYLIQNINNSDVLIFSSKYTFQSLSKYVPIKTHSFIIPNGVDPLLATELNNIDDTYKEKRIVAIGSFHQRKCFDILIESSKYLYNQGVYHELIIAGDGPEKEDLLKRIKGYKHIIIQPFLNGRIQVAKLFKSAQLICHPAIQEDFGNLYIEAGAAKRPIVAANSGAALEYVSPGDNGILFNKNNWRDLANVLEFLLENPKDCMKIGRIGYDYSLNFTWENYSSSLIKIMKDLL